MPFRVSTILAAFVLLVTSAAAATTVVATYHPTGMRANFTVRGNCWTSSIATSRADAYRCMVGNTIYDPCFTSGASRVACPTDLLRNRGVVVQSRLARNPAGHPGTWAMLLARGAMCTILTGTTTPGYPFGCTGARICSAPHRAAGGYRARCANDNGSKPASYAVTRIWL